MLGAPMLQSHVKGSRASRPKTFRLVLFGVLLSLGYLAVCPFYYTWVLGKADKVGMVVHYSARVLGGPPEAVFVCYDRLALSPVARLLGLYQDRSPERVQTFHLFQAEIENCAEDTVWLTDVPVGPIAQVALIASNQAHYVPVRDGRVVGGRISVWAE